MTTASWNRRTEAQTIASSTLAQLSPLWLRGRRRFLTLCKGASGLGSHPVRAHASSSAEGFSPFHSAGGPRVTSILHARPPMRGREKKIHVVMADIDTCGRMAEGRALPGHRYWSKRAEIQHRACPDTQSSEVLLYLASKPRFLHGLRLEESVLNTQYSIFSAWYLRRTNF